MTQQTPNQNNEPIIPSGILLALSGGGFVVALALALTQATFGAVGWGALAVGVIALFVWALMNPEDLLNMVKGRGLAFGGTALVVTALFIIAAIFVYNVVKNQGWRQDFSNNEVYSLNPDVRDIITSLADDPTVPALQIVGFYDTLAASDRDRAEILLQQFTEASAGKVTFSFVDPNREPLLAEQYGNADEAEGGAMRSRQYAVVPVGEDGSGDLTRAILVRNITAANLQYTLVNEILRLTASGDFRAYVLEVQDGISLSSTEADGAASISSWLVDRFNWTVESVNPIFLTGTNPQVTLGDPAANGEVVIIPGGSAPLTDDMLNAISTFVDGGGDLILMGDVNVDGGVPLAAADNLSAYLWENFGIRMKNDFVVDPNAFSQDGWYLTTFGEHPVTTGIAGSNIGALFLLGTHSIEINSELPANVIVTPLVSTSADSFARPEFPTSNQLTLDQLLTPTESDVVGSVVVAVAAENTATGAKVVVFGSDSPMYNVWLDYASQLANTSMLFQSLFWTVEYEDFANALASVQLNENPSEAPILIDPQDATTINFVSIFALPFGLLGIGVLVWWFSSRRAVA
jgi:hypothetical protein